MNPEFWNGRRVAITGHTGFKGAWLALWLSRQGARVSGLALAPETEPSLFQVLALGELVDSRIADIRLPDAPREWLRSCQPEVVFHLAAQALVRDSYRQPLETFATNVLGTLHVLEAVRQADSVRAVVVVTSDKCYENREWCWPYRETDHLGGHDPYSASKACAEISTAAYRRSFFAGGGRAVAVATARAGNVIGGGDWARDRVVPDAVRAFEKGEPLRLRNPDAIRPWQHVLDALHGYVMLAEQLWLDGPSFAQAWNFGPEEVDARSVSWLVRSLAERWGGASSWENENVPAVHEAHSLRLDSAKARSTLGWRPRLGLGEALDWTVDWYRGFRAGADMRNLTQRQLAAFAELG